MSLAAFWADVGTLGSWKPENNLVRPLGAPICPAGRRI